VAEHWQFETSYEDVEFLGGNKTREVLVTGIRTKPSGIYVEVRVPKAIFTKYGAASVNDPAGAWATIFETIARMSHVAGVQWGQESKNGMLEDVAIVTVESDSGESEATVTVPIAKIGPNVTIPEVAKLNKQLNALEAA
jgi:hypothetical protein